MGLFTKIGQWAKHPKFDTSSEPKEWLLGLVLILILAFLWSRVIKQLVEG